MLVVISAPKPIAHEAALINELFDAGLKHFHLRKEGISRANYEEIIARINPSYYDRLVLHQFHELGVVFSIERLHYKESNRTKSSVADLGSLKQHGKRLSTSVHELSFGSELECFEYAFYGPVHDSLSKSGYLGLPADQLVLPAHGNRPKLIAIGGILESNIEHTLALGFDGVAVLGAIWNTPESAVMNFKKIQERWQDIVPL